MEVSNRLVNHLLTNSPGYARLRKLAGFAKPGLLGGLLVLLFAGLLVMSLRPAPQAKSMPQPGAGMVTASEVQPGQMHLDALVLVDVAGDMSVDDVAAAFAAGRGKAHVPDQIMPTDDGRAVWYQLQLPRAPTQRPMVMTLPHPGLDTADLYLPRAAADSRKPSVSTEAKNAGNWTVQRSGDKVPVAQWPVGNLFPAFEFTMGPSEPEAAYLRVTNIYAVSVNWNLHNGSDFRNQMKNGYLLLGIYIGLAVLVVAFGIIQGAIWHEPICYFYAAYVAVVAVSQLALTGLAGEYFWPTLGWWNDRSLSTLALGSSVLLHLFFIG